MIIPSTVLLILSCTSSLLDAATRQFNLEVSRINAAPDGYHRSMIGVNGQFPGPPIIVDRGDKMVIRVKNRLAQPTSLHAHGLFQRRTPFYDGVAGLTQCPIQPSDEMTYYIDTENQAGTTWYHAHYMAEYVDGFYGPLIIRDPHDPHRHLYDEEMVITLSDYYHKDSRELAKWFMSPASEGNEPIPDSGLINGKGRYNCGLLPKNGRCDPKARRENFNFVPGRRYRLRIINTSALAAFKFSIDGHKLTVIEADMVNLRPVTVDRLNINVAQRYSVIVTANQKSDNYWMRAIISTACFPTEATKLDRNVLARVHYRGAHNRDPTTRPMTGSTAPNADTDCVDLNPMLLVPLVAERVHRPTQLIHLDVTFDADAQGVNRGMFNNVSFVPDFSRSMLEDITERRVVGFSRKQNVYQIPYGSMVRIVLNNHDGGEHPFHLHGYEFQVLAWEKGVYDPKTSRLNLNNPVRRDTTTVPANGYTVLQFRADNYGLWAFHCHIEWHVLSGLVMQFQVGSANELAQRIRIPAELKRHCLKARVMNPFQVVHDAVTGMNQQLTNAFQHGLAARPGMTPRPMPMLRPAMPVPREAEDESIEIEMQESGGDVHKTNSSDATAGTTWEAAKEDYLA